MRPSLNILEPALIGRIVDEAKRVLVEHGMEIRGAAMRRRLLDAGLPQRAGRPESCSRATSWRRRSAIAPSSFRLYDRAGEPSEPTSARTASISSRARPV